MNRLTVTRFVASRPTLLWKHELDALHTGYRTDTIVLDGPPAVRAALGENARTIPSRDAAVKPELAVR